MTTVDRPSRARLAAVVLDVDGTLVDSERDGHRVAFNVAFERAGLPYHWDVATYGRLLAVTGGRRRTEVFLRERGHSPGQAAELAAQLHAVKTAVFTDMVESGLVPLRPGVLRLVERLRAEGVRLFVATTGSRAWVGPLLDRHFAPGTFEVVLTGTEVTALKPDPAVYDEVLRRGGLDRSEVVVVEDSRNGLLAAKAAGLPCVVVTNEYTRDQALDGADLLLDGFGELTPESLVRVPAPSPTTWPARSPTAGVRSPGR